MSRTPKVALLVETSRGYGRALLRGIVRYSRLHGPWAFHVTPGDFEQAVPRMREWGGTGIIARIETPAVARAVLRDENAIMTVSTLMEGGICLSLPAVVDRSGVSRVLRIPLAEDERRGLDKSASILRAVIRDAGLA